MAQHMAMKMVDVNNRDTQTQRKPFGKRCAHKQRTQQPRATRKRDGRQIAFGNARTFYGRIDHRHYILLVRPRCQFRHHTAIFLMHTLRSYNVREQQPVADHRRRRIVAARLNPQYRHIFNSHILFG